MDDNSKSNYKPVTHVIFDMDGLLLDTEPIYEEVHQKIASQYGKNYTLDVRLKVLGRPQPDAARVACSEMQLPITAEEFVERLHRMCKEEMANSKLLPDSERVYDIIYTKIAAQYGKEYTRELKMKHMGKPDTEGATLICSELDLPISIDEFLEMQHRMAEEELQNPNLMPGVDRLVRHLAKNNVPIAIATSGTEWMSKIKTQNYPDLFALFDHAVYGGTDPEVKHGKPAPDIYLICASRFSDNPSPENVLVFEDAPNGVVGSVRAGMQVVMIPVPEVSEDLRKPATLVLNSMADFQPEWFGLPPYDK